MSRSKRRPSKDLLSVVPVSLYISPNQIWEHQKPASKLCKMQQVVVQPCYARRGTVEEGEKICSRVFVRGDASR